MMIKIGKVLMIAMWILIISSPWSPMSRIYPLLIGAGIFVLFLHSMQMLLIKTSIKNSGYWCKGDSLQLMFFGVFALMEIRKRMIVS
ncbi:DUF1145 domain-containing protein [Celerinatantimonas diazotrophica]|uniref:Uncharacterized protein YhhL (DUF1145 family) n=1 Tax=Celerinatantimonas diazotrophica TaxID=412034 RepID=A0A4R1K173_9GAMM|nr:DUF1145 domain-containing protein [Celerinatantimonas diazotrophica]TCK57630.1 uncharacterized protein YhhL (DUF1145 family) [Celerinatantimonas diazotrophica]CAG9298308.1 hypothetical protein CEDIAZO_03508 [Celerinatantimonas diazotrophica]